MKRLKALILVGLFLAVPSIAMAHGTNIEAFMGANYALGWSKVSDNNDQIWKNIDGVSVTVEGLYNNVSGLRLGYNTNDVGTIDGTNVWFPPALFVDGSTGTFNLGDKNDLFIWALWQDERLYSRESANPFGLDYMQTYLSNTLDSNGNPVYVLAWLDKSDTDDFNALFVEVHGANPYSAVPEPATMLLFGLGLLGLAGVRRKLKK